MFLNYVYSSRKGIYNTKQGTCVVIHFKQHAETSIITQLCLKNVHLKLTSFISVKLILETDTKLSPYLLK